MHKTLLIWRLTICTGILLLSMLPSLHASEDVPFITNDEEYAVMAAILFPDSPRPVDPALKAPSSRNGPSLAGIPSDFFNLSRLTTTGSLSDKGLDRTMIDDFNRKNATAHQINPDKFAAAAPKGNNVTLITPKRFSMDDKPGEERSGITYISRPGFDMAGTRAVLNVSHVADLEMGIGYRVIVEKSPLANKWAIVDAVINRRY